MTEDQATGELLQQLACDPSVPFLELTHRPLGLFGFDVHSFSSSAWKLHKRVWGCRWDRPGQFEGELALHPRDGRSYDYIPSKDPLRFRRPDGGLIQPTAFLTDCGSIPRLAWVVPGFDPWTYVASYVLHDWLFGLHATEPTAPVSFEDANLVLAEALYTQMTAAEPPFRAPEDWRVAWAVYTAVSSPLGRRIWGRSTLTP